MGSLSKQIMNIPFKTSDKKILVSNPGKQYAHQFLYALQVNQWNYKFITSFWYKPGKFPFKLIKFLPGNMRHLIEKEFYKRYDVKLDGRNIVQFPWFEFIREISDKLFSQRFAERMLFYRDRIHDRFVASRLEGYNPDIVIGYEESCLHTFRKAKEKGLTTVLDLAQIHYKEISSISKEYPFFGDLYKNVKLRNKINLIKEEELSLVDYIICLSDFAKGILIKQGISSHKIFVANPGFDPLSFTPKINYSTSGKLNVVFAGTMTKRKGIDLLLRIKKELADKIELTLIGPMSDAKDLMDKYKGSYTWHAYVEHAQLNKLLNQSDLFVFPSYLDSWAMVVIEAMAVGLPVIVSDNTGAKAAMNSDCGFEVPVGDLKSLREKIMYFYEYRNELKVKGENARKEALKYTWENYHIKINNIIKELNGEN